MFEKLIWVEKNSLSESFCNEVIEKFEKDSRKSDGVVNQNNPTVKKEIKDTKDLIITDLLDWVSEDQIFFNALKIGLENRDLPFHIPVFICGNKNTIDGRIVVL